MNPPPGPSQRVSPVRAPDDYALPSRPAGAAGLVVDAFRQTQFLLGADLALFAQAMNLQVRIVRDAYPPKYRTHAFAALASLWSRTYQYLADACDLLTKASYVSTLPLVRAACECIAAAEALRAGEMETYSEWLGATLRPDEAHKAFEFQLGRYFSGRVLHDDPVLQGI